MNLFYFNTGKKKGKQTTPTDAAKPCKPLKLKIKTKKKLKGRETENLFRSFTKLWVGVGNVPLRHSLVNKVRP